MDLIVAVEAGEDKTGLGQTTFGSGIGAIGDGLLVIVHLIGVRKVNQRLAEFIALRACQRCGYRVGHEVIHQAAMRAGQPHEMDQ